MCRAFVNTDTNSCQGRRRLYRALADDELLPGGEVRHTEIDLLATLVRHREVGGDDIGLAGHQQRNTVGRVGRDQFEFDTRFTGNGFSIIDIQTVETTAGSVQKTEWRITIEYRNT